MSDKLRKLAEAATPDIVAMLKSPANVFYEYAADNGDMLTKAADEIISLRAKVKRQAEALKPFASKYRPEMNWSDDMKIAGTPFTYGDFRRAAQEAGNE